MLTPAERLEAMSIINRYHLAMQMYPSEIDTLAAQAAEELDQYIAKIE